MDFAVEEQEFMPEYERTMLTDELHYVCCFRTDYEFILKRRMKEIEKKIREDKILLYFSSLARIAATCGFQRVAALFPFLP